MEYSLKVPSSPSNGAINMPVTKPTQRPSTLPIHDMLSCQCHNRTSVIVQIAAIIRSMPIFLNVRFMQCVDHITVARKQLQVDGKSPSRGMKIQRVPLASRETLGVPLQVDHWDLGGKRVPSV